ncbi:MAG: NIL domain-containing protein [Nitrospiria bacterium]
MATFKIHITFPENRITDPIIYHIGQEFKVVTNIRRADVTEKTGWMDVELVGESGEIERAVAALKGRGVKVDPIERNIIE